MLMRHVRKLALAAAIASSLAAPAAFGAAIDALDQPARPAIDLAAPFADYKLDTEMVVQNWVVCVSRPTAEEIVNARARSVAEAQKAYAQLKAAKSCGLFRELRVILQQPVYASQPNAGYDARVFGGLVKFSGTWAAGYLVYSGVTD
jgi:hypothetical protein